MSDRTDAGMSGHNPAAAADRGGVVRIAELQALGYADLKP
jgi:hypothetical protein